jgi:peptidylprolyl isomerase
VPSRTHGSLRIACCLLAVVLAGCGEEPTRVVDGATVELEYSMSVDGEVFEDAKPMTFVQGQGDVFPTFEAELTGLAAGDERLLTVLPEEGFGEIIPGQVVKVPLSNLPQGKSPEIGQMMRVMGPGGQPIQARVQAVEGDQVTLDANHPLAVKTLNFQVRIVSVTAPAE